jgi:hypothetical protein
MSVWMKNHLKVVKNLNQQKCELYLINWNKTKLIFVIIEIPDYLECK